MKVRSFRLFGSLFVVGDGCLAQIANANIVIELHKGRAAIGPELSAFHGIQKCLNCFQVATGISIGNEIIKHVHIDVPVAALDSGLNISDDFVDVTIVATSEPSPKHGRTEGSRPNI